MPEANLRSFSGNIVLVDHLFLVDKMIHLANQIHELIDIARPIIQCFVWIFGSGKVDDPNRTINLCPDSFGHHQWTQSILGFLCVIIN